MWISVPGNSQSASQKKDSVFSVLELKTWENSRGSLGKALWHPAHRNIELGLWFCFLILGCFSSKLSQIHVCFVMLNLMNGNINWRHNGTNLTDVKHLIFVQASGCFIFYYYYFLNQAVFFSLCIWQNVYSGCLIYILSMHMPHFFFFFFLAYFCSVFFLLNLTCCWLNTSSREMANKLSPRNFLRGPHSPASESLSRGGPV